MISRRSLLAFDFELPRPVVPEGWLRVHRTAMACRVEVTLPTGAVDDIPAATDALSEADRVEALLTVFRDSSELSRINRDGACGCNGVDEEVLVLLQRCLRITEETGGAFDITSTPISRCWGFLDRDGRVPSSDDLARARAVTGMSRVTLDVDRQSVSFAADGMELNLNAIGKGYALDRMAVVLRQRGVECALLSAGGSSVRAVGAPRGGWRIDVRSPLVGGTIARLRLYDGALGTSGAGEQFVVDGGRRYGHVIDPRTGVPASGIVSATVVSREASTADALSTAFLVGGPELAERYCGEHPETLALMRAEDGAEHLRVYGGYTGVQLEVSS